MQLAYHGLGFVDAMTQYVVLYILSFTFIIFIFGSTYILLWWSINRWQLNSLVSTSWTITELISRFRDFWNLVPIYPSLLRQPLKAGNPDDREPFQQIVRACESSIWEPGLDWNIWEIRPHSDKFHQFSELAEAGKHCIGAESVMNITILLENVSSHRKGMGGWGGGGFVFGAMQKWNKCFL